MEKNSMSAQFSVGSGVRQGSCLSPAIFNVFMNVFVVQLKMLNIGCHVTSLFISCMLYADDIILICPPVDGLQQMLDKCSELASYLSLSFNVNKSHCIAVGKIHNYVIKPMTLCGNYVEWCNSIKYLGVYLQRPRAGSGVVRMDPLRFLAGYRTRRLNQA